MRRKILRALARSISNDVTFDETLDIADFKDPDEMYNKLEIVMTDQDQDDWEIEVEISTAVTPGYHQTREQPGEPSHTEHLDIKYRSIDLDGGEILTEEAFERIELKALELWEDTQHGPEYEKD